jgi:hypothetical protein
VQKQANGERAGNALCRGKYPFMRQSAPTIWVGPFRGALLSQPEGRECFEVHQFGSVLGGGGGGPPLEARVGLSHYNPSD